MATIGLWENIVVNHQVRKYLFEATHPHKTLPRHLHHVCPAHRLRQTHSPIHCHPVSVAPVLVHLQIKPVLYARERITNDNLASMTRHIWWIVWSRTIHPCALLAILTRRLVEFLCSSAISLPGFLRADR